MKKITNFCFLLFVFCFIAHGQNALIINLAGSPSVTFPLSEIQRITFNDGNMLLKTISTTTTYPLNSIASITFFEKVGITENPKVIDVNVYVNHYGEIVVNSQYQINQLTVFDLAGRQVALSTQSKINVSFLNTGIYILQVVTEKGIVIKKIMKN